MWGKFEGWSDSRGRTARVCPECGCVGGVSISTGATVDTLNGCDKDWISFNGNSCEDYGRERWCKKDGDHYGPNWQKRWGKLDGWSDSKMRTALVCPECGCEEINSTDANNCSGKTCSGVGQCLDGINNYTCKCNQAYTGKDCQTNIDDC